MNTKTVSSYAGVQHPQTEAVPQPLEIHPSVDPELARGLINAVEYINAHPEDFDMYVGFNYGPGQKGCVMCHVERTSNFRRPELCHSPEDFRYCMGTIPAPLGHWARIYLPTTYHPFGGSGNNAGRIARIEHFLRTGE